MKEKTKKEIKLPISTWEEIIKILAKVVAEQDKRRYNELDSK